MAKTTDDRDACATPTVAELTAQEQLSARPSPRLHVSASMPNIWRGSPISARRSSTRLLQDDSTNGNLVTSLQGLAITTPPRAAEGRAPGQPLTPPESPNAPTSNQQRPSSFHIAQKTASFGTQTQASPVNMTPISPFRTTPTQFDPFSSCSFNMLPSPARTVRREELQQPAVEEIRPATFGDDPFRVQFPRTEPDAEKTNNAIITQSAVVSAPMMPRQRQNSPISILDSDYGRQRGGRLLLVENVPPQISEEDLKANFAVLGDLKGLYVRFLRSHGVVILAFYDMLVAEAAHRHKIRDLKSFGEGVTLQSRFISPTKLSQYFMDDRYVDICEGEVYISTTGDGSLNQTALQNVLATFGPLRQFRVLGSHGKAFFAEFFDTRDAKSAVGELNNRQILNITLRLTHRRPLAALELTPPYLQGAMSIADLQREQDEAALFQHYSQIAAAKQREEELSLALPTSSPDGVDIARGGPFDATVGTLGRRGSFPGSSPRIDEREERFAALTDGLSFYSTEGAGEFERERKCSNIYGADQSKVNVSSYPSPRTPTRTTNQSVEIVTPKKKHSLPPYGGPLPPPDTNGNMAWPLPQRLPTPPLSAGLTSSGSMSSGADSPEFFIPTQTPPRRHNRTVHGASNASTAHAFLPASARAVLDVLREPPPERNKIDLNRIRQGLDTRTTVMLKNVPNKMTDKHLMAFIDTVTPKSYSFLYLRMDFENHCNVGYAFVNFIDVSSLLRFAEAKLGQKWGMFNSEKVLHMSYANYQGKEALIEKFRNSGVMEEREAWRPKIFYSSGLRQGELEPFPPPNNHLRQQRSFQNGRAQGLYSANGGHISSLGPHL